MTGAALAWIGFGLAVLPVPRPAVRARRRAGPRRLAGPGGLAVAVGSVVLACLMTLGPRSGTVPAAVAALAVGTGLRRVQGRPRPLPADRRLALVLDLAAAALRSGCPVADALARAAPAAGPDTAAALLGVTALLRLGADAAQAWSGLARDGPLSDLAGVAVRSATSGGKLARAFEDLAAELRLDAAATAAIRAQRAGVTAMGPLAACFLPSFVCLGVVPVVVGIAQSSFAGLN